MPDGDAVRCETSRGGQGSSHTTPSGHMSHGSRRDETNRATAMGSQSDADHQVIEASAHALPPVGSLENLLPQCAAREATESRTAAPKANVGAGTRRSLQTPSEESAKGVRRMSMIAIHTLESVSIAEAEAYLDLAKGDEIAAAYQLAVDRNELDGSSEPPDETEVHHALFLLRRAQGLVAPSYDDTRFQLRQRQAA